MTLEFTAPSVGGSGVLAAALAGGHIPPETALVWPLVALSIAGMAYDLGREALQRNRR
ncbi:hypothetical protein ACIPSJ_27000 [Streptomyces sp. NPDC090088]|uniref:hypothetical protein n=1 Tax=Streptomyces sp. NPDC090088 TaxID=3365944 RepID=UPI003826FF96